MCGGGEPISAQGEVSYHAIVYLVYTKTLTKHSRSLPIVVSGSWQTEKQNSPFDAVTHRQEIADKVAKPASHALLSRMHLALHTATRNTLQRFPLCASNVCLVVENPTGSTPALLRGTMVNRTDGTHKNLPGIYFAICTNSVWYYLVWSPVLVGLRGSMIKQLRQCMAVSIPPYPPHALLPLARTQGYRGAR